MQAVGRNVIILAAMLIAFALAPREAAALCKNGTTAQSVVNGQNLADVILTSDGTGGGCTITVGPGTYDGQPTSVTTDFIFRVSAGITIQASDKAANHTILRVSAGTAATVSFESLQGVPGQGCPSNATLDGFTITGGNIGIQVATVRSGTCTSDRISGVTLRNLTINNAASGHGIYLHGVQNSVVDSNTVVSASTNGIYLDADTLVALAGSNGNIIMHNTIVNAGVHAIAIQGGTSSSYPSNNNTVVGNTIQASGFDGILLNSPSGPALTGSGASYNRVERNVVGGFATDGIVATDASSFNYIGQNTVTNKATTPPGVSVWVNNNSNGTYVFGNDVSKAPENGIDVLLSTSTFLVGNKVHQNGQGGIWASNYKFSADATAPAPADVIAQGNWVYYNLGNQVNLEGVARAELAYNYISGLPDTNKASTLPGLNLTGIFLHENTPSTSNRTSVATSGVTAYENIVTSLQNRAVINATTTTSQFFRNRFLDGSNNTLDTTSGRAGLTYSYTGADVQWDTSRFLGGNKWSDFTQAAGNPDPTHQYKGFIYDQVHGADGNGPFVDKFPYATEDLANAWAPTSVTVVEPASGAILAAGSTKTIRWIARGCVAVNISYGRNNAIVGTVASNYPNTGFYTWTLPSSLTASSTYFVEVQCLDSTLTAVAGVTADSATFTVGTSDLILMTPGRAFRATNQGTVRVAWVKSANVGTVNIYAGTVGGSGTFVGSSTGTWKDVTLPAALNNSGNVVITIHDSGNATFEDSTDGSFMVRGSAAFLTSLTGQVLQMGTVQALQWVGPPSSVTVTLVLMENGSASKYIVQNLPDFGAYTWLVPEMWSANSRVEVRFFDASGTQVGTADSGIFNVYYTTTAGNLVARYRLYSFVTFEHLFTTDLNEYNTLGQNTAAWSKENVASQMYTGPVTVGGFQAVPYYRLYDQIHHWHHWTTDRNEYFTLRLNTTVWLAEGVDGYIFNSQAAGTKPWYRLVGSGSSGIHTWTADQNEYNTLIANGWKWEQTQYVFP